MDKKTYNEEKWDSIGSVAQQIANEQFFIEINLIMERNFNS